MHVLDAIRVRVRLWRSLVAPDEATRFSLFVALLVAVGFALVNAVAIVQALNLYHAVAVGAPVEQRLAMRHGEWIFALERRLHVAVEPVVQHALARGLWTPLGPLTGASLRRCLVWVYLHAFPVWLFAALVWSYVYKPLRFAELRDLTIVSTLLAVACYRLFPAAPPRFVLDRAPYQMQDWTYGGSSIDPHLLHALGFNPYAAFPSVHLLWALIPALCVAIGSRSRWVWLCALCYPLLMAVTVIGTATTTSSTASGRWLYWP